MIPGFGRAQAVHDGMEAPNTDACFPCQDAGCEHPCSGDCCDDCDNSYAE